MLVQRSFNKAIPVVQGVVFALSNVSPVGVSLFLENQHTLNTLVYLFEESPDGTTWTRMTFPNGGDSNEFALLFGTAIQVRIVPSVNQNTHIRMQAYGDVPAFIGLTNLVITPTDTTEVDITL